MEETNKSVEQQILDSDLVNNLRRELGEQGEQLARAFIKASSEDKLITIVLMGWRALTRVDMIEGMAMEVALKKLMEAAPVDTTILIKVLINGINRIMPDREEE